MIAQITGSVEALAPDSAVIAVAGVGLLVQCTPDTLAGLRPGAVVTLATALVVREDSLTLYGFATADERAVFESLQTATGVGPRLAQAVLAVHRPDAVRRAVADEDVAALCAVPGVGRKVAQRLILELRDRLGPPEGAPEPAPAAASGTDEARSGLLSLGYGAREADAALAAVGDGVDPADTPAVLRAALAQLRRT
ncbi:MAG TPA: Holliday junction branch migration protein RuvA [Mycobacteriales bacterium]